LPCSSRGSRPFPRTSQWWRHLRKCYEPADAKLTTPSTSQVLRLQTSCPLDANRWRTSGGWDQRNFPTGLLVYKSIAVMRALLFSHTIPSAVTGTTTPSRALVIVKSLGFQPVHYVNHITPSIARASSTSPVSFSLPISDLHFLHLSFLIPINSSSVQEIPPSLVSVQLSNVDTASCNILMPLSLPICMTAWKSWNNATLMPVDYRQKLLRDIEDESKLRIGIVTDTCTYGLDVKNLWRVILFDSPTVKSSSSSEGLPQAWSHLTL